jgi:vitamin B12 transporter
VFGQNRTNEDYSDRASLAAGVRYNKTGDTEATVWNVSGRFDVSDAVYLQANAGTAFSLPSAEQLFAVDPFSTFGNRELKAERSRSINLSVGGQFADNRVQWLVTGFARKVKNLITFSDDPSVVPAFIQAHPDYSGEAYVNAGTVKFSGFEAGTTARLTDDLQLAVNYTHARAKAANGLQIDRIPRDYAKANLQWAPQASRFGGSVAAVWTGDVYQAVSGVRYNYGDEVVIDLDGHVWLDDARKQRVIVSLKNALNNDYVTRLSSAVTDSGVPARFNFGYRGLPRTLSVRYSYAF